MRECSEAKRRNQKHGVAHGVAGCWQVCKAAVLSGHAGGRNLVVNVSGRNVKSGRVRARNSEEIGEKRNKV